MVDALDAIGLSPKGACGDVVRNVTGCPLAGVAADELIDASPIARAIAHELTANSEFYNLPRKFKISRHRLPVVVHLSRDQRHWADGGGARRRSGLLAARGRRPFERAASCRAPRRVRSAGPGGARGARRNGNLPRSAGAAREPRSRAPEVPVHARRLDGGALSRRAARADRLQARSGGAGGGSRRDSSRSCGHSSAAAAGTGVCGRIGAARPHDRRAAGGRGGAGRAVRQRVAARHCLAESGDH